MQDDFHNQVQGQREYVEMSLSVDNYPRLNNTVHFDVWIQRECPSLRARCSCDGLQTPLFHVAITSWQSQPPTRWYYILSKSKMILMDRWTSSENSFQFCSDWRREGLEINRASRWWTRKVRREVGSSVLLRFAVCAADKAYSYLTLLMMQYSRTFVDFLQSLQYWSFACTFVRPISILQCNILGFLYVSLPCVVPRLW